MSPKYLSDIIPCTTRSYSERNANNILLVRVNNNYFINIFFPSTITEWNKLDLSICNSTSLNMFKGRLLQFVRPLENSVFTSHNPIVIKYLTRMRLGFSHLFTTNLNMVFQMLLIRSVAAAQQLKILFITSFIVPTFQLHEIYLTDQFFR